MLQSTIQSEYSTASLSSEVPAYYNRMHSYTGLKRSMPCTDLISMGSPSKDQCVLLEASRFLDESMDHLRLPANTKRPRLNIFNDADFMTSPATAALEESLAKENLSSFDHVNISLLSACVPEFQFPEFESHHYPCKYQESHLRPCHSSVSDVGHILAQMTTSA